MPPTLAAPSPSRAGALVSLVGIVVVGIDLRPALVSIGPILPIIRRRFALSHAAGALLTAIPDLLMALLAVIAPWLAARMERDRVIVAALLLLLLATAARAGAGSATSLFLSTAGVGAGIAIAGALIGGHIKAAHPDRAAFYMGVYTAALSLGSTLSAAVIGPVAQAAGWRAAAGGWAALGGAAIPAWLIVTRRRGEARVAEVRAGLPWRRPKARGIGGLLGAQNFVFYAMVAWLPSILGERGASTGEAGAGLAVFTAICFVSNLVAGVVSRGTDRRPALAVYGGLCLAGVALLAAARGPALPFIALAAFGLGGVFTLAMTLPLDNATDAEKAVAWGALAALIAYLLASLGPLSAGWARDLTGTFTASLWSIAGACIVIEVIVPFVGDCKSASCNHTRETTWN